MTWAWDDARVETLKRLAAAGKSSNEIYREMRAPSRSAVIGKMHRLGLQSIHQPAGRPRTATPPRVTQPESIKPNPICGESSKPAISSPKTAIQSKKIVELSAAAQPAPPPVPVRAPPVLTIVPSEPVTPVRLTELGPHRCKFCVEDGPPGQMDLALFCNAPVPIPADPDQAASNYCPDHHQRCFNPRARPKPKPRAQTTPAPRHVWRSV